MRSAASDSPVLAAVATGTAYFERARLFNGPSIIELSGKLAQHEHAQGFRAVTVTTTVSNHVLEDVVLDGGSLILFKDGAAIPDTAYFEPPDAVWELPAEVPLAEAGDGKDFAFGFNNAHPGYQHWMTQCLPAIDHSLRNARARPVRLLLPGLAPWQAESLALLGYDRVPRLTPRSGTCYRLPRVTYSTFLNGMTSFDICLSALETLRRVAAAVPPVPAGSTVIYVDDPGLYYGPMQNREEVLDLLRGRGVAIVEPGRLSVAERISLFRNAEVVIGPLGQGLTDVVFCRPGTLLWEWMPSHQLNPSFNRLAQAAGVDYWGELFDNAGDPGQPGSWAVDIGQLLQGLAWLSARQAERAGTPGRSARPPAAVSQPIDALVLGFESLGDNCEFGLVQRRTGVEPLGLLRFNGFFVPPEYRLERLVDALNRRFDGLGARETIRVIADGIPGQRELIVRELAYEFYYHTGVAEGEVPPEVQAEREVVRLGFLRRKLLEDLASGDKTWVWKSRDTTPAQAEVLMGTLRGLGPNVLLWVVEADQAHGAGTIEPLAPDFIKGYVQRFAPADNAVDIHMPSWLEVCWRTDMLRHPGLAEPEAEAAMEAPVRRLSAMEMLASNPAAVPSQATKPQARGRRIWGWLRGP